MIQKEIIRSLFNLSHFISENVTFREQSMFCFDMEAHQDELKRGIEGKSVCVIGGAGSIGSSFIKALLPYHPASLTVVDYNENGLAELVRDIRSSKNMYVPEQFCLYPIDYSSGVFKKILSDRKGFDIVANFSAHKHVRSEKDHYSIEALIRNNLLNANELLELLSIYPPEEYFCVSTDKAANPVNIMGASKRIMEDLAFCYSDRFAVKTARFANVAFSNGSLLDGFLVRISKGQPLSGPMDVRRFFVSPEESGQICLMACILADNREILFPKLDESQMMSFDTIGRRLLEEFGYQAEECSSDEEAIELAENLRKGSRMYPVRFSASDTSGEKSYEEFYTDKETLDLSRFSSLGVIVGKMKPNQKRIGTLLKELENVFSGTYSKMDVLKILEGYLPDFHHVETGKNLDGKM